MTISIYIVPNTEPLTLSGAGDPLVYEKEIIYEGDFYDPKTGNPFKVDAARIAHWQSVNSLMLANGIDIPVPVEHTVDPEKTRAKAIGFIAKPNKKGKLALYALTRFRDLESAKLVKTANVSIHAPKEFVDGLGRKYIHPIQHIALTDYPVIPGLEDWQPIAASLIEGKKMPVDLKAWAKRLNIANADSMTEEQLQAAIDAALPKEPDPTKKVEPAPNPAGSNILPNTSGKSEPPANNPTNNPQLGGPNPTVTASMVGMLRENRENKINNLLRERKLTAVQADNLKKKYITDQTLTLSLTAGSDGFEDVIALTQQNEPFGAGEKTGAQVLTLSNAQMNDPKSNPMIADAMRRAEAAKQ